MSPLLETLFHLLSLQGVFNPHKDCDIMDHLCIPCMGRPETSADICLIWPQPPQQFITLTSVEQKEILLHILGQQSYRSLDGQVFFRESFCGKGYLYPLIWYSR